MARSLSFLSLVQEAYREMGLPGTAPASTLNQVGRAGDMVRWVLDAHEEIQTARRDWVFDWAQGTFSLISGTDTYDATTNFGVVGGVRMFAREGAYVYPTASGVNSRNFLILNEWEDLRTALVPVTSGIPVRFAVKPDEDVIFWPRPDRACTAVMEYWRNPEDLSAFTILGVASADHATNIPRMPEWSHRAISWKAVMIGCGKTKDFSRFDTAEENYEMIFQRMLREKTPVPRLGMPLA